MADTDDEYASEGISGRSTDDEGCSCILFSKHLVVKLTGRKRDVSEARWITEGSFAGMAEVTKVKGKLLQTTGIVREGRIFLHIEEIGYLMQREALKLYHQDAGMTIMTLYSFMMKSEYGCTWDAFKVYQELKTLGYVVSRHKVPWSISSKASVSNRSMLDYSSGELSSCFDLLSLNGSVKFSDGRDLDLVFDVFTPNSKFKKSDPGTPDFSLLISSDSPPGLVEIEALRAQNGDIPVMVAAVDCGRVSFFQFEKTQLPILP